MLKVLVNAYACNPKWGSEQGIGWHWTVELAKFCKVFVITEGEFKDNIEKELLNLPQKENLSFIYNNVSPKVRKMCWNQGDWRFYYYYRTWQKRTLAIAEELCKKEHIDIIHQLNMQGFREPGLLWKIKGPKFVWGPVGGMGLMPMTYLAKESFSKKLFFGIKNIINQIQYRYQSNVKKAIKKADVLLSSTPEEVRVFRDIHHKESYFINDTGCDVTVESHEWNTNKSKALNLIWVAKFDFRKQLDLAIKSVAEIKDLDVVLNIVGTGKMATYYKRMAENMGVADKCIFWGQLEHDEVLNMMIKSDIFFFTSISEATSTVILEAIGAKLPIVCFDTCGFGPIVDEKIGVKIPVSNPETSVLDFSNALKYLYYHRGLLPVMSKNCEERQMVLTWEYKARFVSKLYHQLVASV